MANRIHEADYYVQAMVFCRSQREETGLTQNAVAEQLGVSKDTYWRWESGNATLTDGQLKKLLKTLGKTQEELDQYLKIKNDSDVLSVSRVTTVNQSDQPVAMSDVPDELTHYTSPDVSTIAQKTTESSVPDKLNSSVRNPPATHVIPKRISAWIVSVAVLFLLAGYILGSTQTNKVLRASLNFKAMAGKTISNITVGQGASRPELFQGCYMTHQDDLGKPKGAVLNTPVSPWGESGECQQFVKGWIYLSHRNDKAYAITGGMARAHEQNGGITGVHALGFPTSDKDSAAASRIHGLTPGRFQRFEGGSLYESRFGIYPVIGSMSREHERSRGTDGKMGFPAGIPHYYAGKIIQDFEGGRVTVEDM